MFPQKFTAEEAKDRADRLSKMRHLLFYAELKSKRLSKIKSKEYHRCVWGGGVTADSGCISPSETYIIGTQASLGFCTGMLLPRLAPRTGEIARE